MRAPIHLVVESGPAKGMSISVPPAGAVLGRGADTDIKIGDELLSRHHCRFFFQGGFLRISDLNSANETRVNDQPVRETSLKKNDLVYVGQTVLRVSEDRSATEVTMSRDIPASRRYQQRVNRTLRRMIALPVWGALICWWLFVTFSLVLPPDPGGQLDTTPADAQTVAAPPGRQRPSTAAAVSEPTEPGIPLPEAAGTEAEVLAQIKHDVIQSLFDDEIASARQLVEAHRDLGHTDSYRDEILHLQRLIQFFSRVNDHVADALSARLNEEITISNRQRSLRIVPRIIAGQQVQADVVGKERGMTFKTGQMPPQERARWLAGSSIPQRASKSILYLQAGDLESAQLEARGAGPLSSALLAFIRERN